MKDLKWSEARHLWEMSTDILDTHGDMVDNIHICEHDEFGDQFRKIYCSEGYCFELKKEQIYLAEDEICLECEEGFLYSFTEPWDEFKEAGYEGAIEVLRHYTDVTRI